ncbi:MAG: Ig-like domain-containing protein [Bacteroidetes bacterium]|nr:Ig-like domain-containing protein [Bacteroidota bacterium]
MQIRLFIFFVALGLGVACKKQADPGPSPVPPASFSLNSLRVDGQFNGFVYSQVQTRPELIFTFSNSLSQASVREAIQWKSGAGAAVPFSATFRNNDSTVLLKPTGVLDHLARYTVTVPTTLLSKSGGSLQAGFTLQLYTALDSTDKFPRISDEALLTKVQQQTFQYFWEFAHPVSGLARERNTSGDLVTSGGSGFGIMAIPVAIERGFISREDGLARLQKIVTFLEDRAVKFHGAFPHWLNGATGAVIPFSQKDNGADLVETSFLMQGLLTARQYFAGSSAAETSLRADINTLWRGVEWNWFRKDNGNVLYWHWSPDHAWDLNLPIRGWNETLITFVLAASSPTHTIPKVVYTEGFARSGAMQNGRNFYGYTLPLGENLGGPLFFAHYSFLGLNPTGLTDAYANYFTQNKNHTLINRAYCLANPQGYRGYSASCWGLTASDIPGGYTASSPTNDRGVIAPTAALSSFPYTPQESMRALHFYYYTLGDRLWGKYGFHDAFSLHDPWFADSYLAIDQGPIILMIENYRSGLPWKLFMSCPEVQAGLRKLDFSSPTL